MNEFNNRRGDGSTIKFDRNLTDKSREVTIGEVTSNWARSFSHLIADVEEIKQKFEALNKEKEKTNDSGSTSKPNTQPKVTRSR